MNLPDPNDTWKSELSAAEESWRNGQDGRARVCCRRAVGGALRFYATNHHDDSGKQTAFDRILAFSRRDDLPAPIRQAAIRLTTNVRNRLSPDFTFNPILDAKQIIEYLSLSPDA
jgi:hypothetical protein